MNGYRGALLGLPPSWEEESETAFVPAPELPFSVEEIEDYLRSEHNAWCLQEESIRFQIVDVASEREIGGRHYWQVHAQDGKGRMWIIFVGSGVSCFRPDRFMRRWMTGMLPDGTLDFEQMFDAEIEDQMEHDRRLRSTTDQEQGA